MRRSAIRTKADATKNTRTIKQKLVYINKKGTFQWRKQCEECKHKGVLKIGLGGLVEEPTCDRDELTWRRMYGQTEKECKFWEGGE